MVNDAEFGTQKNGYLHNVYAHKMHTVVLKFARSERKKIQKGSIFFLL